MLKNKQNAAAPSVQPATPNNTAPLSPKEQLRGRLLDTQDLLQILNLSRTSLYNYRQRGLLTPQTPTKGGKVFYDAAQVQKLLLPDELPPQQQTPVTKKKKKP